MAPRQLRATGGVVFEFSPDDVRDDANVRSEPDVRFVPSYVRSNAAFRNAAGTRKCCSDFDFHSKTPGTATLEQPRKYRKRGQKRTKEDTT